MNGRNKQLKLKRPFCTLKQIDGKPKDLTAVLIIISVIFNLRDGFFESASYNKC